MTHNPVIGLDPRRCTQGQYDSGVTAGDVAESIKIALALGWQHACLVNFASTGWLAPSHVDDPRTLDDLYAPTRAYDIHDAMQMLTMFKSVSIFTSLMSMNWQAPMDGHYIEDLINTIDAWRAYGVNHRYFRDGSINDITGGVPIPGGWTTTRRLWDRRDYTHGVQCCAEGPGFIVHPTEPPSYTLKGGAEYLDMPRWIKLRTHGIVVGDVRAADLIADNPAPEGSEIHVYLDGYDLNHPVDGAKLVHDLLSTNYVPVPQHSVADPLQYGPEVA